MPKKPPQNAFYFYMQDYKEEQRQKGRNLNNAQAADQAGPLWRDLPPNARAKYEEKAKKAKQLNNIPEKKFTSTGISIAEIQAREAEQRRAEETEIKEIRNIVKLASFTTAINNKNFYLMDVNSFCQAKGKFVVAEMTLLQFNLADGILNNYHEDVNSPIPLGYASDAKVGCQELGLELPDESRPPANNMQILAYIIDFLRDQNPDEQAILPPIFTMPEKVEAVKDFIYQLCYNASEDERLFRVYKVDRLFFELINAIKSHQDEGFPKESLALVQLKKDTFKYNTGLGCEYHEAGEKAVECTMSRVKRWAYTILDFCCPVANIEPIPGRHVPSDYDIDKITAYKEETKEKIRNTVAGLRHLECSYDMNSTGEMSSFDASFQSVKTRKPLGSAETVQIRRPNLDYSQAIRQPPNLRENTRTPGVGRGQSLNRK